MPRKPKKPARRRAKQARSLETIAVILEAGARVLRTHGYARATTNRIAEVAGVSVATIYQYFANKDELFDALVQRYFVEVLRRVEAQRIDASLPLEETLHAIIAAGIGAQRHGPELLRALEQVPNAVFRRRLRQGKGQLIAFTRTLLEAYRDSLRVTDLDRAATLIVNAAEGIGYNESAQHFNDGLADELTTLFVRYLADPQPAGR